MASRLRNVTGASVESGGFGNAPTTIVFTDVEGSTELRGRLGDDAAHQVLRSHDALVRASVVEFGGREVKALGDGFMLAFASPRNALRFAQAVQRVFSVVARADPTRAIRVRIGVNTGELVEEDGDLFGQPVHAAARIAAKARGGEIFVSEVTRALCADRSEFAYTDRGRFRLKGFETRWRIFDLAWVLPDAAQPSGALSVGAGARLSVLAGGDRTSFVGRSAERALLLDAVSRALAGNGGVVLIGGEPGIGKTRLAEEVAGGAADRGMAVLVGHSYERSGASPYVALIELFESALAASSPDDFRRVLGDTAPELARVVPRLRRVFPDLPDPLAMPADQERLYLFSCLSEVFGRLSGEKPLLLVLDDLQWADEPTLLFLDYLAPQLIKLPLLVVATYRDAEVGAALGRTFADLHRHRLAHWVKLGGMDEGDSAALLTALAGQNLPPSVPRVLHDQTEGNPFFLEEVFRDLVEQGRFFDVDGHWRDDVDVANLDVPEGVRLIIGRRLERLTDDGQRLLTAAAVAGRSFSYRLVQALGDLSPDAVLDVLDEAERAGLIRAADRNDEFVFAHELVRQTLQAALSGPRRRRMHLRAGDAMIKLWAGHLEERAAEIAEHLLEAGNEADPKQLFKFLQMAGRRALDTAAFEEALMHFQRASARNEVADERQRAELAFDLGAVLRRLGHWEKALDAWQQSLALFESIEADEDVGRVCLEVGFTLAWANRFVAGVAMYQRGLVALGEQISPDRARLLARLGMTMSYAGDVAAGDALYEQAHRVVDLLDNDAVRGFVLGEECCAKQASMRVLDVVRTGQLGATMMLAAGDPWGAATALGFVAINLVQLGRFDESRAVGEQLVSLAERLGNHAALCLHDRARGMREFFSAGDFEALEVFAHADLELVERLGWLWGGHSFSWIGYAHLLRGDWDTAGQWLERGSQHAPPGLAGFSWGSWFQFLALTNQRAEALVFVDELQAELPIPGQPNTWTAWTLLMAFTEGLYMLGEHERPAAWYSLIREAEATGAVATSYIEGRLLERIAGISAAAARDWSSAETHFRNALRQADELPHRVEALETRRFYAQMLTDRNRPGDIDHAAQLLQQASQGYSQLNMPRHALLADRVLGRWHLAL